MSNKIWYVEALGHTNEVIAGELPAENAHKDVLCIDGKNRDLWQCDYRLITKLLRNRLEGQMVFVVWYRVGRHGPVRKWPFLKKRKLTLASALKKGIVTKGSSVSV